MIPNSETDHYLSRCAVHTEVTARLLMKALERMNQNQAADVVGRWLRSMEISDEDTSGYRTRGESSASEGSPFVRSRRRGTSEASENWDVCSRSRGGSNASEGSSGLMGSENSVNSAREIPHRRFDSSRQGSFGVYQDLPRTARASSYGSATLRQPFTRRVRTISAPSEHSYARSADEAYYSGSVDRLSCEESQRGSTEQIVPEPQSRCFLDACRNCDHCAHCLCKKQEFPSRASSILLLTPGSSLSVQTVEVQSPNSYQVQCKFRIVMTIRSRLLKRNNFQSMKQANQI